MPHLQVELTQVGATLTGRTGSTLPCPPRVRVTSILARYARPRRKLLAFSFGAAGGDGVAGLAAAAGDALMAGQLQHEGDCNQVAISMHNQAEMEW